MPRLRLTLRQDGVLLLHRLPPRDEALEARWRSLQAAHTNGLVTDGEAAQLATILARIGRDAERFRIFEDEAARSITWQLNLKRLGRDAYSATPAP